LAYSLRVETQPSIGVRPLLILGPTRRGTAGVSKRVDRHLATGERKLPHKPVKRPEARPTRRLRSHRGGGHLVPLVGRGGAAAQQPAEPALPALGRHLFGLRRRWRRRPKRRRTAPTQSSKLPRYPPLVRSGQGLVRLLATRRVKA